MDLKFRDQVVLVTGAGSGIGFATSLHFADQGAHVVLVDVNSSNLKKSLDELKSRGSQTHLTQVCDVSDVNAVEKVMKEVLNTFGRIDVIINNAGLMVFKPFEKQTAEDWQKVLNVDLMGTVYFTQQGFMHMKSGGRIVNVSSVHAVETTPLVSSYAAAKAAVLSMTRSAAIEGKEKNIRVNALLPGAIDTPMLWSNPNIKSGVEVVKKADVGKPEDIASAIAFLASDEAAFITGASLYVDGGRLAQL